MTDKEYNTQIKRLKKVLVKWSKLLGLDRTDIVAHFERERDDEDKFMAAIVTDSSWQYRRAVIHYFMPIIAACDDEELEVIVIHEYMHVIVAQMRGSDRDEDEEYVVTTLANAFRYVHVNK